MIATCIELSADCFWLRLIQLRTRELIRTPPELEDSDSKRRLAAEIAKLTRPTLPARKAPLIHAFEFTHEPAWNTLKDFIESRGAIDLYGSRDASREAFAKGLITNGDEWMAMIQARNRSSHTYNEKTAREIAEAIRSSFSKEFESFRVKFTELGAVEP